MTAVLDKPEGAAVIDILVEVYIYFFQWIWFEVTYLYLDNKAIPTSCVLSIQNQ